MSHQNVHNVEVHYNATSHHCLVWPRDNRNTVHFFEFSVATLCSCQEAVFNHSCILQHAQHYSDTFKPKLEIYSKYPPAFGDNKISVSCDLIFSISFLFAPLPPPRLELPRHGGVGGLRAFLRGDGGSLLPLHGGSRAGGRVRLLPHLAQPLVFLLLILQLVLSARPLSQSGHFQELEEVLGGFHGNADVHRLHPGEGAAQARPQRY